MDSFSVKHKEHNDKVGRPYTPTDHIVHCENIIFAAMAAQQKSFPH